MTADVDIFTPRAFANGFPHYIFSRLRREDPVYWAMETLSPEFPWMTDPGPGYWAVTRHVDVDRVLRDPATFSSHARTSLMVEPRNPPILELQQRQLISLDPPAHSRLRRIVNRAFMPKAVEQLRGRVQANTDAVLDAAAHQVEVDFVPAVAAELPLLMLCEILGVPTEDRKLLFDWTNRLTAIDSTDDFRNAHREMNAYCLELSTVKRSKPTDDIWSTLVNAELDSDDGDGETRLTDDDLKMFWQLLVIAGNETTRNSITGGVLALIEHPDQALRLVKDPSLIATAVEEILRWVSPVQLFRRTATEPVELSGKQINAGDKVVVYHPSANRDEAAFPDPFKFDIGRHPNPHIAFGVGPHFCLGASLARLQVRTMITEIARRFSRSQVVGPIKRAPITFLAGVESMPVRLIA